MSNLIVDGYSGIIAPPNLATNGAFSIDQRGGKTYGSWYPLDVSDYLVDCWKVIYNTIAFTEFNVSTSSSGGFNNGWIGFRGFGKKGQSISIHSRDEGSFGHNEVSNNQDVTATVGCANIGGVPVSIWCAPSGTSSISKHSHAPVLKSGESGRAISVSSATQVYVDHTQVSNRFAITLQEDGEFLFYVYMFNLFAGAFKNPPQFAPVPYADDLARCQRYYQTGYYTAHQKAMQYDTNHAIFEERVGYTVPMVSLPTRSFELQLIESLTGSAGVKNDRTSSADGVNKLVTTINGTNDSLAVYMSWLDGTFAQEMYNFGFSLAGAWTAEVV